MIYSFFHGLLYRFVNKFYKLVKKNAWKNIPINNSTTYFNSDFQLFDPHMVGTDTISLKATSSEVIKGVSNVLDKLEPEPCINFVKSFMNKGLTNFNNHWVYADINTVLYAIANIIKVENYLEIGVRRGRSLCVMASQSKNTNIYGFDLWIKNYTGVDNPGPEFVKLELKKFNHNGKLVFIDGDSKYTIPSFFNSQKDLYFDVITVDGDHSLRGATIDLKNVIKRLKIGGILVFDDISSHEHPYLNGVWEKVIKSKKNFHTWEFRDVGLGVAFAIRKY